MKQDIAEDWQKRLRSGEFPQGCHTLRSHDGKYCCLGVLCEMAAEAGIIEPAVLDEVLCVYTYCGHQASVLPIAVMSWAGMQTRSGMLSSDDESNSLSSLNDTGKTFPEIATVIGENWETL
jgi:hypothetical protein